MAYKSRYKPINKSKYHGDIESIICRSSWERKMCKYLDLNENVLRWSSEEISIPYFSPIDNKWHKYYPDFLAEIKNQDNQVKKYMIEVKPKKQTTPPKKKNTRTYLNEMKTFAINNSKWEAAKKVCDENGWIFKIITEKEIFK